MTLAAAPSLLEVPFDQFYRYGVTALLLKPLLRRLNRPARILEVGCNVLNELQKFLEPFPIELIRCDVQDLEPNGAGFVRIQPDSPLPFSDGAFDYVVALEVLEHVPREDRSFVVSEWLRVASGGVLLTCPLGVRAVRRAEALANQAYSRRHGRPHPFLEEHEQYGLPTTKEVTAIFEKLGATCRTFGNSPLGEWLPLLLLSEELNETSSPEVAKAFNRLLNERPMKLLTAQRPYRRVYFGFKDHEQARIASEAWHEARVDTHEVADEQDRQRLPPVVALAGSLREIFQKQGTQLARAQAEARHYQKALALIQSSTCWRVLALLRRLGKSLSRNLRELIPAVQRTAQPPRPVHCHHVDHKVSIIIPTAGQMNPRASGPYVSRCIESIASLSTHRNFELLVMNSGPLDLGRALEGYPVRTLRYPETSFNYSTSCNLGAAHAGGDYLLFLNDDTEVITPAWLEQMLRYARQPGIGAVGAKLFFADGRLQHAGVALVDGAPGHPHYGAPGNAEGDFAFTMTPRHCLAVTGACLMTSRRLFNEVGGFDRRFPLNYNDVDYCLRLHQRGLRIVFTPHAQLYHYERASRGKQTPIQPSELALFKRIWSGHYPRDPYYHPGC